MPPVREQPGDRRVALPRPAVDTSRGEALAGLFESLGVAANRAASAAQQLEAKETQRVEELLASDLLTEEEISELQDDVRSPLARRTVKNRMGEARVAPQRDALLEKVLEAADPLEARQIIQDAQTAMLASESDVDIQEGIRERFAELAPGLLSEASNRRRARLIEERDNASTVNLTNGFLTFDAPYFADVVAGEQIEDLASGETAKGAVDRAISTVQALYLLAPDRHADATIDALDALLQNPRLEMSASHQAAIGKLRVTIQTDQQRGVNSSLAAAKTALKAELATELANASIKTSNGDTLLYSERTRLRTLAGQLGDPGEIRAVDSFLSENEGAGILGTQEAEDGLRDLREVIGNDPLTGMINQGGVPILQDFRHRLATIDADAYTDANERRRLVDSFVANAKSLYEARGPREKAVEDALDQGFEAAKADANTRINAAINFRTSNTEREAMAILDSVLQVQEELSEAHADYIDKKSRVDNELFIQQTHEYMKNNSFHIHVLPREE